jgi:hypothetical protein
VSVRAGGRQQGSRSGRPTKALELDGGPREPKNCKIPPCHWSQPRKLMLQTAAPETK